MISRNIPSFLHLSKELYDGCTILITVLEKIAHKVSFKYLLINRLYRCTVK